MVLPTGFEPAISDVRGRRPKPLDDGSMLARTHDLVALVGGRPYNISGFLSCHPGDKVTADPEGSGALFSMAHPRGIEPLTFGSVDQRSKSN